MKKTKKEEGKMNTSQLKCFLAVAKTLNFTEAAKSLFMAQPALSKQISLIEQELGMQLFDRTRRYVRLTPQGEVLYEEFRNIAMLLDSAVNKARAVEQDQGGTLNIGVTRDNFGSRELPGVIYNFSNCYPNVAMDITIRNTKMLRDGLESRAFDVVLAMDYEIEGIADAEVRLLAARKLDFVISKRHPLAMLDTVSFEDLSNEAFIAISDESAAEGDTALQEWCRQIGFTPRKILKAPNSATQKLWAAAGMGVSMMDLAHSPWMKESVKTLEVPNMLIDRYVAAWKKDNQNPFISRFMDILIDAMTGVGTYTL